MEVTHYEVSKGEGAIIAFVNFKIHEWGLNLDDCRFIKTKNGGSFIGFPSKRCESQGEVKYSPYFWFEKHAAGLFQSSAKKAIEDYLKKNPDRIGNE